MRSILIDPYTREITEREIQEIGDDGAAREIRAAIQCDVFCRTSLGGRSLGLFLNDHGTWEEEAWFALEASTYLYCGRGLIVASDQAGETVGVSDVLTLDLVRSKLTWLDDDAAIAKAREYAEETARQFAGAGNNVIFTDHDFVERIEEVVARKRAQQEAAE